MFTKRAVWWWWAGVAVVLLASPFALSLVGLLPWSPINCWHYDVDIRSGRILYTRYFAFLPVSQHTEESVLSCALQSPDLLDLQPDWRRVLTLSPSVRNSPHYAYHSAFGQIRDLESYWKMGDFTPAAQRASAKRILQLWQEGNCDDAAKPYLMAIMDIAVRKNLAHEVTDERDLPPVSAETNLAKP